MKWALLFIFLICVISTSASHLEDYSITFTPTQEGILENISLTLIPTEDTNEINYDLDGKPRYVFASSGKKSSFRVVDNNVIIEDNFVRGQEKRIQINFFAVELVEKIGDTNIFSFKFYPPEKLEELKIRFILPKGFAVSDIDPAISPEPSEIKTDSRNIILQWNFQELSEPVSVIVLYEEVAKDNYTLLFVIAGIFIILIILSVFISKIHYKKKKQIAISKTLTSDENKIVSLLLENPTNTQKDLVKLTGFSKAKMSKLVRRLELKGVVDKKPYMTTNKLILTKDHRK